MAVRHRVIQAVEIVLIVFVVLLVAGAALGQPVLFSYVESGSMAPTINEGDGFVVMPVGLQGQIVEGDVVIFEAHEVNDGGLTTHRVVEKTERGYITKGDANPFADQDNNEPPVKRAQIVATALQIDGNVVVVPHFGTVTEKIQLTLNAVQRSIAGLLGTRSLLNYQGLAYLFFAATLVWYVGAEWRQRNTRRHDRESTRSTGTDTRLIVGIFTALLVIGATAAMIVPSGVQQYGIVSAEFESDQPTVIPMGGSADVTYPADNSGFIPVTVYLQPASDGVDIQPNEMYLQGRTMANASLTLHAPPEMGYYRRYIVEHRYLALLPSSVTRSLYTVHPWVPIMVIDALVGVPFYALGTAFVRNGRIRTRLRQNRSLSTRLRQRLRQLY